MESKELELLAECWREPEERAPGLAAVKKRGGALLLHQEESRRDLWSPPAKKERIKVACKCLQMWHFLKVQFIFVLHTQSGAGSVGAGLDDGPSHLHSAPQSVSHYPLLCFLPPCYLVSPSPLLSV